MATRMQLSGYTRYWTRYVLLVLPFYLFTFLPLTAQEYGMRWLYCPQASETQQVWFKRTFHTTAMAKEAVLSVASEGRYIVYVNGYNISADLFSYNPRGAIAIQDYPIENYLCEGYNTIAVWYSPVSYNHRQLYVALQGTWQDGSMFYISDDQGWLCHPANAQTMPDGSELIDGTQYEEDWKTFNWMESSFLLSDWQPAAIATHLQPATITFNRHDTGFRMQRVLKHSIVSQRGNTLIYDFGQPIEGWVRITMRGMKKGDVIEVNGLRYVCKGGTDDQACRRFTTGTSGVARITLPAGRSRSNITKVEAISIGR